MSFKHHPEEERRSPSPAISCLSTPSRAPNTHDDSDPYSPSHPIAEIDEVAALRIEIFKPCRDCLQDAQMMLTWTLKGEQVWMWPSHPDGHLFADYELPTAFEKYYIEIPQCPCAFQEIDPAKRHNYHIWVVQQGQYHDLLANNPDLPSQVYKERPLNDLSSGLPSFNSLGILHYVRNNNTNTNVLSGILPITPPSPYTTGKGSKSPSKGKASTCKKRIRSHAAGGDDPFAICPGPKSSRTGSTSTLASSMSASKNIQSHVVDGGDLFATVLGPGSSLTGSTAGALTMPKDVNTAPSVPESSEPSLSMMPPSNQLALNKQLLSMSTKTTPQSKQNVFENVTILP
ncbi:hypothetical protein K439DRAFT_1625339, partial [Ramaria rubella]